MLLLHAPGDSGALAPPAAPDAPAASPADAASAAAFDRDMALSLARSLDEAALPDASPPAGGGVKKGAEPALYEFLDPLCPACVAAHGEVLGFLEDRPGTAWRPVLLPLRGPEAERAALWLAAASPDDLPALMDRVMAGDVPEGDPPVSGGFGRQRLLAEALQIRGTPAFVMDGMVLRGLPRDGLEAGFARLGALLASSGGEEEGASP